MNHEQYNFGCILARKSFSPESEKEYGQKPFLKKNRTSEMSGGWKTFSFPFGILQTWLVRAIAFKYRQLHHKSLTLHHELRL